MGIVDEDIARVKELTNFLDVVGEHVALRKVGRRYTGLCPFHQERTPSFSVNAEQGLYHCFGCGASGDAIAFVRELDHLDFREAVEKLAAKAGVTLRYDDGEAGDERRRRRKQLLEVVAEATDWYHQRLLSAPDAAGARAYLRSRGYDGDTVRQFQMGYAPDEFDALARALRRSDDVMVDAGLAFINKARKQQDVFRNRVLFPILDVNGDPIAFGGRRLVDGEGPKYKNSAENALYHKSSALYGLSWAKQAIVAADEIVICEGYTDVIGFHSAGVSHAVATCGTALTEDHVKVLTRFARRLVLAYDADAAGQAAAERVYEWEQRHAIEVAVAALPEGRDPAEVAASDPELLHAAVAEAEPLLGFRLRRTLDAADTDAPEGRARGATDAVEVVAEHPDPLVRDQYVMTIADRCRADPERLRVMVEEARVRGPKPPTVSSRSARRDPDEGREVPNRPDDEVPIPPAVAVGRPEAEALRVVIASPDLLCHVDPVLFGDPTSRAALQALIDADGSASRAVDGAAPAVAALLRQLAVEDSTAAIDDVVRRLASLALRRAYEDAARDARASTDPLSWAETLDWLRSFLEDLAAQPAGVELDWDDIAALCGWLRERGTGDRI